MQFRMQSRETAQASAKALLQMFQHEKKTWYANKRSLEQAFEMVERELAGYLSHPNSIYREMFNAVRKELFPGGLVISRRNGVHEGRDLIILFESISKKIPQLKNPEYGIRDIVGYELALQLFFARGDILKKLVELEMAAEEKISLSIDKDKSTETIIPPASWKDNLLANKQGLLNLINQPKKPEPKKIKKKLSEKLAERKLARAEIPPLKPSEITLSRLGVLSFFYYASPQKEEPKMKNMRHRQFV